MSKRDAEVIYYTAHLIGDKYIGELTECLVSDLDMPLAKARESVNLLSFMLGYAAGIARNRETES